MSRMKFAFCSALFALLAMPLSAQKRPLTHADYDGWRHIQNQHLSNDGKFLAYALFPQEGDGELVVRNLTTGKEVRESIGELPPPPPANFAIAGEEGPPPARGIQLAFSQDSRTLVFSTFPSKAEVDQAKRDKKKPRDTPKNGLRIMDLGSGNVVRVARVKSFQVPSNGGGFVAYLREPEAAPAQASDAKAKNTVSGSELALRNLAANTERKFPDVTEYTLTKDAGLLAYSTGSKPGGTNGVYAIPTAGDESAQPLTTGAGKYSKLAWDERQDELAFYGGQDARLYLWKRGTANAAELAGASTAGLPPNSMIADTSAITFSKDGQSVFFGYAPKPPQARRDDTPAEDRVSVDLWHWKDDYIQPMQKVRARLERNRSYRAVYRLSDGKLLPLADTTLAELTPSQDGRYSLGGDDREYRSMAEYSERYADAYLVDNLTGARKLVAKKHIGRVTWAPDGRHAIFFDGKNWIAVAADGSSVNLTAHLPVKFWTEEHDTPGSAAAYGMAGWIKDGSAVLLNDHYDIWEIRPDGGSPQNLTQSYGRSNHLRFRYVRLDTDPEDKGIDPSKPLLLRAENTETHDSGFFRASLGASGPPQKLLMAAKNFSNPIKARNADVLVLSESTFREFPDLRITDSSFREMRQVSDANPQQAGILWGSAELVHFKNLDGVPLQATLYKPDNFDSKKKYPMLVYIYERLTQNLNNYVEPRPSHVINPTFYVSNGYLVLEPDIAYKIGFPGQSALQCVLPAVQAVVDQGFVDENAIGIQGHSWGGYQIAYMVTQTNRFKAVAAGAPVANMTSAYDGIRWGPGIPRQFQYEKSQSRIGGTLWEYPMRYIENSPLFMADRVKTPIMMIHNDADDAVPWYQGIEYFLALRRLGKEAYLFSYNGEPHGLRRRPNQKDYTVRLQQYFDYYLKGAPKPDWMEHGIPYLQKPGAAVPETDR